MANEKPFSQVLKEQIPITDYAERLGFTLVRRGRYYSLKEHDSVMIDPQRGAFWRNSRFQRGFSGGAGSVIDFAVEFGGARDARDAMSQLSNLYGIHRDTDRAQGVRSEPPRTQTARTQHRTAEPGTLDLPERAKTNNAAFRYLLHDRGIHRNVIRYFLARDMLYQDARNNCVFKTDDFACVRSTGSTRFVGDVQGSDYNECFYFRGSNAAKKLIVTESVIDTMSVMSYLTLRDKKYTDYCYLALSGTNKLESIFHHLQKEGAALDTVILSLDNDEAGHKAVETIQATLAEQYPEITCSLAYPPNGKDWNDYIQTLDEHGREKKAEPEAHTFTVIKAVDGIDGMETLERYTAVDENGEVAGTLTFRSMGETSPHISYIETAEGFRRQGVATLLLQTLQGDVYPREINFGMTTPEGTELLKAITEEWENPQGTAARNEYDRLRQELDGLQARLDELNEQADGTDYDSPEFEAIMPDLREAGERWQEIYDKTRDMERNGIEDVKTSFRYVRLPEWTAERNVDMPDLTKYPIEQIAAIDHMNNPERQGTGGVYRASTLFRGLVEQFAKERNTERGRQPVNDLYRLYDQAYTRANLMNAGRGYSIFHNPHLRDESVPLELVYQTKTDTFPVTEQAQRAEAERIFARLNDGTLHPADYYGVSLMVGDVVVFHDDFSFAQGDFHAYRVDTFGFEQADHLITPEMIARMRMSQDVRNESRLWDTVMPFYLENGITVDGERAAYLAREFDPVFRMADIRRELGNALRNVNEEAITVSLQEEINAITRRYFDRTQYPDGSGWTADLKAELDRALSNAGREQITIAKAQAPCYVVDRWQDGADTYILGQAQDDPNFYYVQATTGGRTVREYEFDHRPTRDEVQDTHINQLSEEDIDRHEAEYGADGYRAFPGDAPEGERYTAESVTGIVGKDFYYDEGTHERYYTFDCKINGTPATLTYMTYGSTENDDFTYSIHTDGEVDLWDVMEAGDLERLSDRLDEEAHFYRLNREVQNVKDINELHILTFDFMEDNSYLTDTHRNLFYEAVDSRGVSFMRERIAQVNTIADLENERTYIVDGISGSVLLDESRELLLREVEEKQRQLEQAEREATHGEDDIAVILPLSHIVNGELTAYTHFVRLITPDFEQPNAPGESSSLPLFVGTERECQNVLRNLREGRITLTEAKNGYEQEAYMSARALRSVREELQDGYLNVAIESTEDFSDPEIFPARGGLRNMDVQNPDGTFGEAWSETRYRLVKLNGITGGIEPLDLRVFDTREEALEALREDSTLQEMNYDDLVYESSDRQSDFRGLVNEAMKAAGYERDPFADTLTYLGEDGGQPLQFEGGYKEVYDWLDGVVFEDERDEATERILHPERYEAQIREETLQGFISEYEGREENKGISLPDTLVEKMRRDMYRDFTNYGEINAHLRETWRQTFESGILDYEQDGDKPRGDIGRIAGISFREMENFLRVKPDLENTVTADLLFLYPGEDRAHDGLKRAHLETYATEYGEYKELTIDGQRGNFAYVKTEDGENLYSHAMEFSTFAGHARRILNDSQTLSSDRQYAEIVLAETGLTEKHREELFSALKSLMIQHGEYEIQNAATYEQLEGALSRLSTAEHFIYTRAGAEIPDTLIEHFNRIESEKRLEFAEITAETRGQEGYTVPTENVYSKMYDERLDDSLTAEEWYTNARNNYIDNPDVLDAVQRLLQDEARIAENRGDTETAQTRTEQAERVGYMAARERAKADPQIDTSLYNVEQMKLDFMDENNGGGLDSVSIKEGLNLSVSYDRGEVIVDLQDFSDPNLDGIGVTSLSLDEFKSMTQKDFDAFLGELHGMGMVYTEKEKETEREAQKHEYVVTMSSGGGTVRDFTTFPTREEAEQFINDNNGVWRDENDFEWGLSIDEREIEPEKDIEYQVGQSFYVDGKRHEITRMDDWNVYLMDRTVQNPEPRTVSRGDFEALLKQDERNLTGDFEWVDKQGRQPEQPLQEAQPEQPKQPEQPTQGLTHGEDGQETPKDKLSRQLLEGVASVMNSASYRSWLDTTSRLFTNNYSFANAMLIFAQKPEATYCMGYEAWKDYGRNVTQGAKGAKIFVPVIAYEKQDGALFRMIKKNLTEQLNKNPAVNPATYKVGLSKMEFTLNQAGVWGLKLGGKEVETFGNEQQVKQFIQRNVLNKVPMYFTVGTVFDIKDVGKPQFLWLKKGFTKDEMVRDDKGKPIKNSKGEYKIKNSEERINRFNTKLPHETVEKDPAKMAILLEALKAVAERNNVPVTETAKEDDQTLKGGAAGYYSRATGSITLDSGLNPTEKVAVLIHEMAHSDLHGDLAKLERQMGDKVPREMREVQAESVAFSVAKHFGIETSTNSFSYVAGWSRGTEMQDLKASLEVIYNETKKMTREIAAELDVRGLNLDLSEKEKAPMLEETKKDLAAAYMSRAVAAEEKNGDTLADIKNTAAQYPDRRDILDNLSQQQSVAGEQRAAIAEVKGLCDRLLASTDRAEQDAIVGQLDAGVKRMEAADTKIETLSAGFLQLCAEHNPGWYERFQQQPARAVEELSVAFPSMFEGLSATQKSYIALSEYVHKDLSPMLKEDISGEKFAKAVTDRAAAIPQIAAKNGMFVEVRLCEQWTEQPIVKGGALLHPNVANSIIKQGEAQTGKLRKEAEAKGDYFPYTKCHLAVFSIDKEAKALSCYQTRVDIGDGYQKSLTDFLHKEVGEKSDFCKEFDVAIRERGAKEKVLYNEAPEVPAQEQERAEGAEATITEAETQGRAEDKLVTLAQAQDRIDSDRKEFGMEQTGGDKGRETRQNEQEKE